MGTRSCMNLLCKVNSSVEWREGWPLRSGVFASLCDKCGLAYEQSIFCDIFHLKESGWRECTSCGKRLHCGCIASKSSIELLDCGGVQCATCLRNSERSFIANEALQESMSQPSLRLLALPTESLKDEKLNSVGTSVAGNIGEMRSTSPDVKTVSDPSEKDKITKPSKGIEGNGGQNSNVTGSFGLIKREHIVVSPGEAGPSTFSHIYPAIIGGSSCTVLRGENKEIPTDKGIYESLAQACLNITLGTSIQSGVVEGREQSKTSSAFQPVQRSRQILPKPPKTTSHGGGPEASKEMLSQIRVARPPPGEWKGRNQLLPRYWPRITDQELQQISADSNTTIVPLFEKVLSASDAGRIGRLVLPKACAEAYFPPISQPEGLPLKIQDAKGKNWVFQFRFWPNNNSRMYVLEGVTPCIQSMQLQAGDTVTFSRIDPEGKLLMGFRKATNSVPLQDTQISALANGTLSNETFFSDVVENLPIVSGYSSILHSLNEGADPHLNAMSEHLKSDREIGWGKPEKHGCGTNETLLGPEKKRSRNIKNKRLHIDSEDALELKLTWEEAQDLLRPSPSAKRSTVTIEDHEFEEYEEPPVFGKRTIFTARPSGEQDQWAECDVCHRWRRLPVDVLLPPKWTCSDNAWDPRRRSCSAPDEMSTKELQNLLGMNTEIKRRKSYKPDILDHEATGLDALATAAALNDDSNLSASASATTTRHPRHRPGCTCIVCIQPPSGKGPKHKPTCTCNVCMTVKRRFKTLMMRKKIRQSEREAESARSEAADAGKGYIDLNCHPEDPNGGAPQPVSMMGLIQVARLPLDSYLKQNRLASLVAEPREGCQSSSVLARPPSEGEASEAGTPATGRERERSADTMASLSERD
ncbi:hypothetical protein QJS10_CPA03g00934 [Acorus calamus]|uniref:B3 domain-containing transcription repressor VAL2 n=1 Tax=Acorus calamus TaxID=4465 RepID=A0AAV9F393_ACOCL|nr:hypothetical protein QJS10_CPA03g00934 [Acorus calamus]